MTDPLSFDSTTPRFSLPYLFAGQGQKEAFVNESLAIADSLLHCAVEGVADSPPSTAADGQGWLVSSTPSGDWTGRAGHLAFRQAGNWIYCAPRDGLRVLDRSSGQERRFHAAWKAPAGPSLPEGGTVIDTEARAALAAIISALREVGVFPHS